jgi:hypothetical protein
MTIFQGKGHFTAIICQELCIGTLDPVPQGVLLAVADATEAACLDTPGTIGAPLHHREVRTLHTQPILLGAVELVWFRHSGEPPDGLGATRVRGLGAWPGAPPEAL